MLSLAVILDEVARKLGLVLLFMYGLCLSKTYLKTLENSYVISDQSTYKLGLVLVFRCGLCLSINLFLSLMEAFTN